MWRCIAIFEIGTDIIEIDRIRAACEKNERFLYKVFTERERELFNAKSNKYQTIAGNFAAKEAVVKAVGTGFRSFNATDFEILRDELGNPVVSVGDKLGSIMRDRGIKQIKVSVSHCKDYATATAIAY